MKVLPRAEEALPETAFLRPVDPDNHADFERLLPWCTPLMVYTMDGEDWVRWSMPKAVARRTGFAEGCACCGEQTAVDGDVDDYHVDTAWNETSWWLEANGYTRPDVQGLNTPREGERS